MHAGRFFVTTRKLSYTEKTSGVCVFTRIIYLFATAPTPALVCSPSIHKSTPTITRIEPTLGVVAFGVTEFITYPFFFAVFGATCVGRIIIRMSGANTEMIAAKQSCRFCASTKSRAAPTAAFICSVAASVNAVLNSDGTFRTQAEFASAK
jgi:hypothetical protein